MDPVNPVPEDAFLGIDPDDTTTVQFGTGKFTLGVLPLGRWDHIWGRMTAAYRTASRLVIRRLAEQGIDPEEIVYEKDETKLTRLDAEVRADPDFHKQEFELMLEGLKYGLKKHEGVFTRSGEIAFEAANGVLSPRMLAFYGVNPKLVTALWVNLRKLHVLEAPAKKA